MICSGLTQLEIIGEFGINQPSNYDVKPKELLVATQPGSGQLFHYL